MKGYKGFEPGLVCKGKQYAENTVFKEDKAEPCARGMHFCEDRFEVLNYYPIIDNNGNFNEFAEVEALDTPVSNDGKKFASTKLKIGAKLSFKGFIEICVDFALKKTKLDSGDDACIGSSGYGARIGSSGGGARIGSSGYGARIGSSGGSARIGSSGYGAVIMCAGNNSKVKAKKGSWITLAEWCFIDDKWTPVCVKTEQVDGERIKEDTFYQLKGGEFVECE